MPETILGRRYRVVKKLGEGGMGSVYLVQDTLREDLPLALKTVRRGAVDEKYLEYLRAEFKVLAKLRHPNVASAFDFGYLEDLEENFFTTEFVKGEPLSDGCRDLGFDELLNVCVQSCRGLEYVHSRGLVHHDIKVENILITKEAPRPASPVPAREPGDALDELSGALGGDEAFDRTVKIIDFGLIDREKKSFEKIVGSPSYIPPEKILGEETDRRSDLYSLGVVFYRLFTHRMPFVAESVMDLFEKHLHEPPVPPRRLNPDIPEALDGVILNLLEKDPAKRFPNASQVIQALNEGLHRSFLIETEFSKHGYISTGRLTGRDAEMDAFKNSFDRLFRPYLFKYGGDKRPAAPPARAHCLVSEGGLGKSRLLQEVKQYAQLNDIPFFTLAAERMEEPPLASVADLLAQVAAVSAPEETGLLPPGALGPGLAAAVQADARMAAEAGEDPAVRMRKWQADVLGFLVRVGRRKPFVLAFENLQWADEWGWSILAGMARAVQPPAAEEKGIGASEEAEGPAPPSVMILAAYREEPGQKGIGEALGRYDARDLVRTIPLGPLRERDVRDFVASMFGRAVIPETFLRRIVDLARGNPLFVEEILKGLADREFITKRGPHWMFRKDIENAEMPESVSDILLARIRAAEPESRRLLECLAVANLPLDLDALARLSGMPRDAADVKVRKLATRQILLSQKDPANPAAPERFSFFQSRLAESLYADLERDARRGWHAAIAADLEGVEGDEKGANVRAEELAHHFLLAGEGAKAVRYGLLAGEKLRQSFQNGRATKVLEGVLTCLPPREVPQRMRIESQLCALYELQGDLEKACDKVEGLLRRGETILPGEKKAPLLRKMGNLRLQQGRHAEAVKYFERGLTLVGNTKSLERCFLTAALGQAALKAGKPRDALAQGERALALATEIGEERLLKEKGATLLWNAMGTACFLLGRYREAEEHYRKTREVARALSFPQGEAVAQSNLGVLLGEKGDYGSGVEKLIFAVSTLERIGDKTSLSRTLQNLGEVFLGFGELARALGVTKRALDLAKETRDPLSLMKAFRGLGLIYSKIGRYTRANEYLTLSLDQARAIGERYGDLLARCDRARVRFLLGDRTEALGEFGAVREAAEEAGMEPLAARALWGEGLVHLGEDRAREGLSCLERAEAAFERTGNRREVCEILLTRARTLYEDAHGAEAEPLLPRLEERIRTMGSRELLIDLKSFLGEREVYRGKLDDGFRHLEEASQEAQEAKFLGLHLRIDLLRTMLYELTGREPELAGSRQKIQRILKEIGTGWEQQTWEIYHHRLTSWYKRRRDGLAGIVRRAPGVSPGTSG